MTTIFREKNFYVFLFTTYNDEIYIEVLKNKTLI